MARKTSKYLLSCTLGACVFLSLMLATAPSNGQTPSKTGTPGKTTKAPAKTVPPPAPPKAKRLPLSKSELEDLWRKGDDDLLVNEIHLRGLLFEPEEDYLLEMARRTNVEKARMPESANEIIKLVPAAPSIEAVQAEAPALLERVKAAAQKRSEAELEPLVHPILFGSEPDAAADAKSVSTGKARLYDLFDIAGYRNHTLGRFTPAPNRRVGVQFYQLTTSQVEKLHYVTFANSHGRIVVRDVVSGPEVASMFLRDEQALALSKLDDLFRALNSRKTILTDPAIRNACTPGFIQSIADLEVRLTYGVYVNPAQVKRTAEASLAGRSANILVTVSFPTGDGLSLDYKVEFERVEKDLRIVRVRDMDGGTVAWDPNLENYMNDRYGMPRTAPITEVVMSDRPEFLPLRTIRTFLPRYFEARDKVKLSVAAKQFLGEFGGEGLGIRAAAEFIAGDYDKATVDSVRAIEQGGTVYFTLMRRADGIMSGVQHKKILFILSPGKVDTRLFAGEQGDPESFSLAGAQVAFEKERRVLGMKTPPGPFLDIAVAGVKDPYRFAAFGTSCLKGPKVAGIALDQFSGGGGCPEAAGTQGGSLKMCKGPLGIQIPCGTGNSSTIPVMVPNTWQQELQVVLAAVDRAKTTQPKR